MALRRRSKIPVLTKALGVLAQIAPCSSTTPQDRDTLMSISEAVDESDDTGNPRPALVEITTMLNAAVKLESGQVSAMHMRVRGRHGAEGQGPPRGLLASNEH